MGAAHSSPDDERLFGDYAGRMLVVLTVGSIFATFGRRVLSPLLPAIITDLGITPFEAGIALSIASGCWAILQYPSGRMADQLTRRTVLVGSLSAVFLGAVLLAATPTYLVFVLGAALIGVAEGLYGPASRALLSDLFSRRRGQAFGVINVSIDVAGLSAAAAAIGVLAIAGWQLSFRVVAVAVLPVLAVLWYLSREPIEVARFDVGIRETVGRLVSLGQIKWIALTYMLYQLAVQGGVAFLPTLLALEHGFSETAASAVFGAMFATGFVMKPLAGRLSDRFPRLTVGAAGLLIAAVGLVALVTAPTPLVAVAGALVWAAGGKMFPPVMQAYLMDTFARDSKGGDFGALRTVFLTVASVGPGYVGYVAGRTSFTLAYATLAVCVVSAAGIVLWLRTATPS
jgi:predicted MFS family arabinose efflux permease